jgi:hypothetical protein
MSDFKKQPGLKRSPRGIDALRIPVDLNPDGERVSVDGRVLGAIMLSLCPPPPMPDGSRVSLFELRTGRKMLVAQLGIPESVPDVDRYVVDVGAHLRQVWKDAAESMRARLTQLGIHEREPLSGDEDLFID